MNLELYIGVLGAAIILIAFLLNNAGKLNRECLNYDIPNAIGSLLLVVYAVMLGSIPFIVLNGVWFAFAAYDVVKRLAHLAKSR